MEVGGAQGIQVPKEQWLRVLGAASDFLDFVIVGYHFTFLRVLKPNQEKYLNFQYHASHELVDHSCSRLLGLRLCGL